MQKNPVIALVILLSIALSGLASAHCQIPCGIYGDQLRFEMLREHLTTIEKSMKEINTLSADPGENMNQLVRWVNNKEEHADEITEILTQYFLSQRIKTDTQNYPKKLELLHRMMVSSMKCKQTTDLAEVETLRTLIQEFETVYMPKTSHHTHD